MGGCPSHGNRAPSVENGAVPEQCRGALRGHREEVAGGYMQKEKPSSETRLCGAGAAGREQPVPQTPCDSAAPWGDELPPSPRFGRRSQPAARDSAPGTPLPREPWGRAGALGCHRALGHLLCRASRAPCVDGRPVPSFQG